MNPENPLWKDPHPPKKIRDLLGDMLICPDSERPPRKEVKCGVCFHTFTSSAFWFGSSWKYANVCQQCSNEYGQKEQERSAAKPRTKPLDPMGLKNFYCPRCGIMAKGLRPCKEGGYWVYSGLCSQCGATWENLYHAYGHPDELPQEDSDETEPDE